MNYYQRKHERNQKEQQYKELMDSDPIHKQILDENWDIIQSTVLRLANSWRGWNLKSIKKERVFIVPRISQQYIRDTTTDKMTFIKKQTGWDLIFYNKSSWDFLSLAHHSIWKDTVLENGFKAYQRQTKLDSILDELLND